MTMTSRSLPSLSNSWTSLYCTEYRAARFRLRVPIGGVGFTLGPAGLELTVPLMGWRGYWATTWGGSGCTAADIVWVVVNDVVEEDKGRRLGACRAKCNLNSVDALCCRLFAAELVRFVQVTCTAEPARANTAKQP